MVLQASLSYQHLAGLVYKKMSMSNKSPSLMIRLLLTLSILSLPLFGQRSDTIFQQIGTNVTTAPYASVNVNNIGQSQHYLYVQIGGQPSHICSTPNVIAWFQASYDNIFWFQLTSQKMMTNVFNGTQGTQFILYSTGLAPFVRVYVRSFDTVNCAMNLTYGGSLYPTFVSKLENTLLEGGYQFTTFSQSTAGSYAAIPSNGESAIAVYGLWCSNQTAQVITMGGIANYMASNDKLVMMPTGLPIYVAPLGSSFSITLGSSTTFSCNIYYRYEN